MHIAKVKVKFSTKHYDVLVQISFGDPFHVKLRIVLNTHLR